MNENEHILFRFRKQHKQKAVTMTDVNRYVFLKSPALIKRNITRIRVDIYIIQARVYTNILLIYFP